MKRKLLAFTTSLLMMASTFVTSFAAEVAPNVTPRVETGVCITECDEHAHDEIQASNEHEHHDAEVFCEAEDVAVKQITAKTYNAQTPDVAALAIEADSLSVISAVTTHTHSYTQTVGTKRAATCTEKGLVIKKCSGCSSITDVNTPALGHNYTSANYAATCTMPARTVKTCTRCGVSSTTSSGTPLGHSYTKFVKTTKAATCTTKGAATYQCSRCTATTSKATAALGHSYKSTNYAATCTMPARTVKKCTRCGVSSTTSSGTPLGHSYTKFVKTTKAATCTTKGAATYQCSRCTATTSKAVKALGHSYTKVVGTIRAATCTQKGLVIKKCSRCTSTTQANTTILGHNYTKFVKTTKAATCTTNGAATYQCSRCTSKTSKVVKALGHNYSKIVGTIRVATCTEKGLVIKKCSRCTSTSQVNTTAPGHKLTTKTVEPTCTTKGYTLVTCTRANCNYSVKSKYTSETGHDYDTVVAELREATPTENGLVIKKCSKCNSTKQFETEFVGLSVPLKGQDTDYTCGSACGNMILQSLGVECSEADFWDYANSNGEGTYVYRIEQTLDHFLGSDTYRYVDTSSMEFDEYYQTISESINNGYPVQVPMAIPTGSAFGYSTKGHYVLVTGIYKNATGEYVAKINDPFSGEWYTNGHQGQQIEVKLSDIQQYNANHSAYIICN